MLLIKIRSAEPPPTTGAAKRRKYPRARAESRPRVERGWDRATGAVAAPGPCESRAGLLNLDCCTRVFELLLDLRRLVLVDAFLDRLRRAFDQVLGLFEAEVGDRAHLFDDIDLFVTSRGQDDSELSLLGSRLSRRCTGPAA